jgi:hypothetical protein
MKIDPGMHIGLNLVFFGKPGVTRQEKELQCCIVMINVQIICVMFYDCIPLRI